MRPYADGTPASRRRPVVATACAVALLGVLVVTRSLRLGHSLTNDEAYTLVHFARPGPRAFLQGGYIPNDHLLFSALTWFDIEVLGARTEVEYRLWGVVPGLASVGVVAWWIWRRLGPALAVGVLFLVVVSPLHGTLAWQARGYGLAFLSGALMLVAAAEVVAGDDRPGAGVMVYAIAGALGIWTLPILVLPFVAGAAVMVAVPAVRRWILFAGAAVGGASALVYAGIWRDVVDSSSQEFGARLPWHGPVTVMVEHLLLSEARLVDPGVAPRMVVVVFWLAAIAGSAWIWRRTSPLVVAVLWAPYVLTAIVLTVARFHVEPRFVSYLLFNVLVLIAAGAAFILELVRDVAVVRVAVMAGLLVFGGLASRNYVRLVRHELALPIEDYQGVAAIVNGAGVDRVVVNSEVHVGFEEYLGAGRVTFPPVAELERAVCHAQAPIAYVEYGVHAAPVDLPCLASGDAVGVVVPQQNGWLDRPMRVWLLGAGGAK